MSSNGLAKAEVFDFFCCPNSRCPVRFYPVEAGIACPACQFSGVYAGKAMKISDPTEEPED